MCVYVCERERESVAKREGVVLERGGVGVGISGSSSRMRRN